MGAGPKGCAVLAQPPLSISPTHPAAPARCRWHAAPAAPPVSRPPAQTAPAAPPAPASAAGWGWGTGVVGNARHSNPQAAACGRPCSHARSADAPAPPSAHVAAVGWVVLARHPRHRLLLCFVLHRRVLLPERHLLLGAAAGKGLRRGSSSVGQRGVGRRGIGRRRGSQGTEAAGLPERRFATPRLHDRELLPRLPS